MSRSCAIDKLPEAQRKKVVDALLAGQSLRKVSKLAGVSHTVVDDYKRRVVLPALATAQKFKEFQGVTETSEAQVRDTVTLTRDIVKSSPFRDRLQSLWDRTEKSIERAEQAVRVVTDRETGRLLAVGADVAAIAPLLNQAHKNLEMLGQVTGELAHASSGPNVNIQINIPAGSSVRAQAAEGDVVEIE